MTAPTQDQKAQGGGTGPTGNAKPASKSGPYMPTWPLVLLIAGVVCMSVDTLLAKATFDVLVNENETVSWLVAIAISGIAALSAMGIGSAYVSGHRNVAILFAVIWTSIGIALAAVRFFSGLITGDGENDPADMVLAGLMLALYLAAGFDVAYQTTKIWRPEYFELVAADRRRHRAQRRLSDTESEYARIQHEIVEVDNHGKRMEHGLDVVLERIDHMERQLYATARNRLALRLADPGQTSLYRTPAAKSSKLPVLQHDPMVRKDS